MEIQKYKKSDKINDFRKDSLASYARNNATSQTSAYKGILTERKPKSVNCV